MAYTQKQLDALDAAIAAGELEVSDGDTRVRYRSMSELQEARRFVASQMANANSSKRPARAFRMTVNKGI